MVIVWLGLKSSNPNRLHLQTFVLRPLDVNAYPVWGFVEMTGRFSWEDSLVVTDVDL